MRLWREDAGHISQRRRNEIDKMKRKQEREREKKWSEKEEEG